MDAALKAKWVEALRSNKYPQARAALHCDDGYCCLGVLNEVLSREQAYGFCKFGIPLEIENQLILLNDDDRKSFPQIADYIEVAL